MFLLHRGKYPQNSIKKYILQLSGSSFISKNKGKTRKDKTNFHYRLVSSVAWTCVGSGEVGALRVGRTCVLVR